MNVRLVLSSVLIRCCITPVAKVLLLSFLVVVQTPASESPSRSSQRVAQSLEANPETTLFVRGLKTSDLWEFIEEVEEITLFVPKDKAVLEEGSDFLLDVVLLKEENHQRLNAMMALHVIPGRMNIEAHQNKPKNYANYSQGCLSIEHVQGSSIRVGPEALVTDSVELANGRIFYIDRLLWEPYEDAKSCKEHTKQATNDQ